MIDSEIHQESSISEKKKLIQIMEHVMKEIRSDFNARDEK